MSDNVAGVNEADGNEGLPALACMDVQVRRIIDHHLYPHHRHIVHTDALRRYYQSFGPFHYLPLHLPVWHGRRHTRIRHISVLCSQ